LFSFVFFCFLQFKTVRKPEENKRKPEENPKKTKENPEKTRRKPEKTRENQKKRKPPPLRSNNTRNTRLIRPGRGIPLDSV